jgi:hypothetical protein
MVYANSIVQVCGSVTTDGIGGISSTSGYGFTASIVAGNIRITFAHAGGMGDTSYYANSASTAGGQLCFVVAKTTSNFDVAFLAPGGGALSPLITAGVYTFSFLAVGLAA